MWRWVLVVGRVPPLAPFVSQLEVGRKGTPDPLEDDDFPFVPSVEDLLLGRWTNEANRRETPTDYNGIGLKKAWLFQPPFDK